MTAIGLTRRQSECFGFIQSYSLANGSPPSFDEMRGHLGLASLSGVARLVAGLVERGAITRRSRTARSIEIIGAAHCPNCGQSVRRGGD